MSRRDDDGARVRQAFLDAYLADLDAGQIRELRHYQTQWPGFEEEIADEYWQLEEHEQGDVAGDVLASLSPGSQLGPYRILEQLGRGGQGVVLHAEDTRLRRPVALKVLTSLGSPSPAVMQRFAREAEVASHVDHPGICSVYEAGVEGGVPFIAMRYVEGESLAERISKTGAAPGGHDLDAMLLLLEDTARALHAAHESGAIHRDIKPANVMIDNDGHPVILDFGLARMDDAGLATLTRPGDLFGTPVYMSPEQVMGEQTDRRTDIWSLGATLYEMVTGERAFARPTKEAMFRAIRFEEPVKPRDLNSALSRDLETVIETALSKELDGRYATALDLAEDLRRIRAGDSISARPVSMFGRTWRWAQRRPAFAGLVVSLLIAVPGGSWMGGYLLSNVDRIRAAESLERLVDLETRIDAAYMWLHGGDPARAVPMFEQILRAQPAGAAHPEAVAGLVFAHMHLQHLPEGRGQAEERQAAEDVLDRYAINGEEHGTEEFLRFALESFDDPEASLGDVPLKSAADYFVRGWLRTGESRWMSDRQYRDLARDDFTQAVQRHGRRRLLYDVQAARSICDKDMSSELLRNRLDLLTSIWRDDPDRPPLRLVRGMLHHQLATRSRGLSSPHWKTAETLFRAACASNPEGIGIYLNNLGVVQRDIAKRMAPGEASQKFQAAINTLGDCRERCPSLLLALVNLGDTHLARFKAQEGKGGIDESDLDAALEVLKEAHNNSGGHWALELIEAYEQRIARLPVEEAIRLIDRVTSHELLMEHRSDLLHRLVTRGNPVSQEDLARLADAAREAVDLVSQDMIDQALADAGSGTEPQRSAAHQRLRTYGGLALSGGLAALRETAWAMIGRDALRSDWERKLPERFLCGQSRPFFLKSLEWTPFNPWSHEWLARSTSGDRDAARQALSRLLAGKPVTQEQLWGMQESMTRWARHNPAGLLSAWTDRWIDDPEVLRLVTEAFADRDK